MTRVCRGRHAAVTAWRGGGGGGGGDGDGVVTACRRSSAAEGAFFVCAARALGSAAAGGAHDQRCFLRAAVARPKLEKVSLFSTFAPNWPPPPPPPATLAAPRCAWRLLYRPPPRYLRASGSLLSAAPSSCVVAPPRAWLQLNSAPCAPASSPPLCAARFNGKRPPPRVRPYYPITQALRSHE